VPSKFTLPHLGLPPPPTNTVLTHVAFVGTRTIYSIKSALRDVGRTFEIPPSEIFAVTKEIDESISLEENLKKSKLLKSFVEKYLEAFKIASQITGVTSNFGVHAGGVVISDVHYPLNKTLPLHRANNETPATIFDKDEIQDFVGLVKYDLLGVNALSQIAYTKYLLKNHHI
jgi:DNA polymerase III alpha subunit